MRSWRAIRVLWCLRIVWVVVVLVFREVVEREGGGDRNLFCFFFVFSWILSLWREFEEG